MKKLPLRWRLLIPIGLVLVISTAILAFQISNNVYTQELELVQQRMASKLRLLADIFTDDWAGLEAYVSNAGSFNEDSLSVLRPDGQILYQSEPQEINLASSELQQALAGRGDGFSVHQNEQGEPNAYAAIRVEEADGGMVLFHLSHSFSAVVQLRAQIYRTIWFAAAAALLLSAAIILFVTGQLDSRLGTLTGKAELLETGQYGEPIQIDNRDELSLLEHALNRQAAALTNKFQRIEQDQSQLNAILNQMTDGVMIVNGSGEITLINPAAVKIFGLEKVQLLGQRLPRVLAYHQILELWQDFQSSGEEQAAFLELTGRKQSIYVILIPFEEFLPNHALILVQDLTRLRHLETVRRDFISNVSHELRTPLASLKALSETLQISALDDPDAGRKFLARMETEIDALTELVGELLELSRIESGQVPLQLAPIDPCKLITTAYERLKVQADQAGIEYTLECPETGGAIMADANRMEQTLVNIIQNAIKYTNPGGRVACVLKLIDGEAVFKVIDTGVGISGKDLSRIFERFYKVRTNQKVGGTGLGLAIAKHLVELHNGRIWAESQLGIGSTFFIALPLIP